MKKLVLIVVAVFGLSAFCLGETSGETSIEYNSVEVPWSGEVLKTRTSSIMSFSDGSCRTFYYWQFKKETLTLDNVIAGYAGKYESLYRDMTQGGISTSFAKNNMSEWQEIMSAIIDKAIVNQANTWDKKLEALWQNVNAMPDETEIQTIAKDAAIEEYLETQDEYQLAFDTLKNNVLAANASIAQSTATRLDELEDILEVTTNNYQEAVSALGNTTGKSESEIATLRANEERLSFEVTSMNILLGKLQSKVTEAQSDNALTAFVTLKSLSSTTNFLHDIRKYVGSTNTNLSVWRFKRRESIYPNTTAPKTIYDKFNELGVVNVESIKMKEALNGQHPFGRRFDEVLFHSRTNITASFSAPTNWADYATTVATNGFITSKGVMVLNNAEVAAARAKGAMPPSYFEAKEETGAYGTRTNIYARPLDDDTHKGFSAPKNWVDGTTIVCTDGVYRVIDSISSNTWNKLRRSLEVMTNEMFKAGGLTNWVGKTDGFLYGNAGLTNALPTNINVDNALDGISIWTNGNSKIEIKGFCRVPDGTFPCKKYDQFMWRRYTVADDGLQQCDGGFLSTTEEYDIHHGSSPYSTNRVISIFGASHASPNTIPILIKSGGESSMLRYIGWISLSTSVTNENYSLSLHGFKDAGSFDLPYKSTNNTLDWLAAPINKPMTLLNGPGGGIRWGTPPVSVKIVGTDDSYAVVGGGCEKTNTVTLASDNYSNVKISVNQQSSDSVRITFGVYYK